jgi:putative endonuclease
LGERIAADFIVRRGARLLGRNLRAGRGEIDLHVALGDVVVAVEVKTVTSTAAGRALRQFTGPKAAAVAVAGRRLHPATHRVDLIEVVVHRDGADVRWMKDVV